MDYRQAREVIRDGDVVFLRDGKGIGARVIQWVMGSPYEHVAIAFHVGDRLMVVESRSGGRRIVTMSVYEHERFDVLQAPVPWVDLVDDALAKTGIENYGYRDLYRIAMRERFGWDWGDTAGEVCSEFVAKLLNAHGMLLTPVPSPGKLFAELNALTTLRCEVRP